MLGVGRLGALPAADQVVSGDLLRLGFDVGIIKGVRIASRSRPAEGAMGRRLIHGAAEVVPDDAGHLHDLAQIHPHGWPSIGLDTRGLAALTTIELVVHEASDAKQGTDAIAERITHFQELEVCALPTFLLAQLSLAFAFLGFALNVGVLGPRPSAAHGPAPLRLLAQDAVDFVVGQQRGDHLCTTLWLQPGEPLLRGQLPRCRGFFRRFSALWWRAAPDLMSGSVLAYQLDVAAARKGYPSGDHLSPVEMRYARDDRGIR